MEPIRQLTPADARAYRTLRLAALQGQPEAFGNTFEQEQHKPSRWFAQRLACTTVFGGFADDALMGMAGFLVENNPKTAHKGWLWGCYVDPQMRGRGLGRRLVEAVLGHAARHVEQINLSVVVDNPARDLYLALGFVEFGRERRGMKQHGVYYDESLMVKFLHPPTWEDSSTPPKLGDQGGNP